MTSMHHSGSGRSFSQVGAAMVLIAVLLCVEQLLAFR
ncbi:hypothetical protein OKW40_006932 [Paraburkholderia sp. RAU6.4a]